MTDDILSLERAAMERWRNGDPFGFVELSADDVCYVDPGLVKPILGIKEYQSYMDQAKGKIYYQGSEFIEPRVVRIGDAALLSYNYRSTELSPEGKVLSQTPWNATEVYFKRQGEWKIVHTHWSFVNHHVPEEVDVPLPIHSGEVGYPGVLGELMQLESRAMERWRKGDPWGFVELYTPEVTYFDTGTPVRINGKQAMSAELKQRRGKIFYDVMDFVDPWIAVLGDVAVLFYRFFSTWLEPNGSISRRTPWNSTEVYQLTESGWKIIHNHWSHIRGEMD